MPMRCSQSTRCAALPSWCSDGSSALASTRVDGLVAVAAHIAWRGLVPHVVALGAAAQRAQVDDALQLAAQRQAQVLQVRAVAAQQGQGLGRGARWSARAQAAALPRGRGSSSMITAYAALAPHGRKRRATVDSSSAWMAHGAAGRLPVAAGKAPVAHALSPSGRWKLSAMENWRGAARRVQHRIKAAKVKVVVGLVPAQVQVDGAVGRNHGLLEQQQALQQRGLARRVAAQQHGDGRQLHRAAVAPGA